jgi:myo-inositol 2-dehydrogenase/D-chiro-inositol 1-dehydrogenase
MTTSAGLIGAGRMGAFHAETLARRLPGTRLAAIADPAPGAARQLADRLGGGPRALTDPGQLLADPAIDAVVIVTPARTHAGLVEAAARAGKAVYCEKPMALTLADADRAIEAAREAGVPLQVGFNRRYDAGFRAARDTIAAGCVTYDQDLFRDAYIAELADFADCARTGRTPAVTGQDARAALAVARAAIQSVTTASPVRIDELKDE